MTTIADQLRVAALATVESDGYNLRVRQHRDDLIRAALNEGMTVRAIGQATGLSIGRISQIASAG